MISDHIAEREKDPRKAAALMRARKKLAGLIDDGTRSVATLRLAKGFSQQQLADRMGVSQPYVARMERGEDVKISTVANLARALNEPAAVVFEAMESVLKAKELAHEQA